jgi:hypothetical protein
LGRGSRDEEIARDLDDRRTLDAGGATDALADIDPLRAEEVAATIQAGAEAAPDQTVQPDGT